VSIQVDGQTFPPLDPELPPLPELEKLPSVTGGPPDPEPLPPLDALRPPLLELPSTTYMPPELPPDPEPLAPLDPELPPVPELPPEASAGRSVSLPSPRTASQLVTPKAPQSTASPVERRARFLRITTSLRERDLRRQDRRPA
jgi:hypothetical protein